MNNSKNHRKGQYKEKNGKTYGPYYYHRAKHYWQPKDVARVLIMMKKTGRHDSGELIASILDAFKLRAIVCAGVQVYVFLQNTALLASIILILKFLKALLNIWQLFSSGSLKILKIGVYFFKFEIANTILSKVLLRFVAVSIALDTLIIAIGLYAELLVAINPITDILDEACSWQELAIDGVELVAGVAEASKKAHEVISNNDAISKAIDELLNMEDDVSELNNQDWSN